MSVRIDRKCANCEMTFKQNVGFSEKDGKITVEIYQDRCPFCAAFVKMPTPGEVKRALILKEMQKK